LGSSKQLNTQYDFSIVIVTLNAGKSISKCLEALDNQSFKNFQVVNIDGCSTDNTQELISKFSHLKITSVIEPDDGLYFAMNKGIDMATG
jgi:glycosyltransferase involved in cell wall biosynthesis